MDPARASRVDLDRNPLLVCWEVTKACSLACTHCRAQARALPGPGELGTAEALRVIDDLARFDPPGPTVVLTGGDPPERPDLVELVRHAAGRGLKVAVAPAATPKLTRETLRTLHDAGASAVALSLDAGNAQDHDAFRRAPGSFARACQAVRDAAEVGLVPQVNTVAHPGNLGQMAEMFLLLRGLGAQSWEVIPLIATGRARAARLGLLDPTAMEVLFHFLVDAGGYGVRVYASEAPASRRVALQRRSGARPPRDARYRALRDELVAALGPSQPSLGPLGRARSGSGFAFIAADGTLMPSGFLSVGVGNVREVPVSEMYRDHPLFRALRDPAGFAWPCGLCSWRDACGGSRARAYAATRDPFGADPSCRLVAEAQRFPGPRPMPLGG